MISYVIRSIPSGHYLNHDGKWTNAINDMEIVWLDSKQHAIDFAKEHNHFHSLIEIVEVYNIDSEEK